MNKAVNIKPIPLLKSVLLFGIPGLALYLGLCYGIPIFHRLGLPEIFLFPFFLWLPLISLLPVSLILFKRENRNQADLNLKTRFRLNRLTKKDWLWVIGGSLFLIADPSGKTIQIPIELLNGTPFSDYLIPGIILLFANGILSVVIAILTVKKIKHYQWFIILQGCVLIGWLTVELILNIEFFSPVLHYPLYSIGIIFIVTGLISKK